MAFGTGVDWERDITCLSSSLRGLVEMTARYCFELGRIGYGG